jgi:hypothetical protein
MQPLTFGGDYQTIKDVVDFGNRLLRQKSAQIEETIAGMGDGDVVSNYGGRGMSHGHVNVFLLRMWGEIGSEGQSRVQRRVVSRR